MNIQLSDHFTYKKLIQFTLPSIGMMIFMSIYGVVDGFFVSNFTGKTAFAAVNLMYPVLMILATVGFMFGTGGSALVAKTFGEGKPEKANEDFSMLVYLSFGIGVLLSIISILNIRPIAIMLGATGELLENSVLYASIFLMALPFNILQFLFQSFFVTAEKPQLGLITSVSAGITNIALDAILVIGLPQEYKLAGAAIATAMSQVMGGGIPLIYFARKNSSILHLGKTTLDMKSIIKAATNGSSEFMSNIAMSVVSMLYNMQLMKYAGENGIAAYGVMMYVSMIFSGAFIGYSIGTAPIVSYHYGAKNHEELKGLLKKSIIMISGFAVCMVIAAELLARPLSLIFVGYDVELLELTVSGFRIFGLSFLFMGFAIYASGFFTALNDGLTSALISFLRTMVFQIAAVMLLPLIWDIDGVWISIVVAELMAVVLSGIFLVVKREKYQYF